MKNCFGTAARYCPRNYMGIGIVESCLDSPVYQQKSIPMRPLKDGSVYDKINHIFEKEVKK